MLPSLLEVKMIEINRCGTFYW